MQIQDELKHEICNIKNEIEKNPEQILNNALDILLITDKNKKEIMGFSILITYGGPNIRWDYLRGSSKLIATWGNEELEEYVDTSAADHILDILDES